MARKSFWAWGMEDTEPTDAQRREAADSLSRLYGVPLEAPPVPKDADLDLRKPRITPPSSLESICSTDLHDRAAHSYGRNFADKLRAFRCEFPNPPDVVAYPKTEGRHRAAVALVPGKRVCSDTLRRGQFHRPRYRA